MRSIRAIALGPVLCVLATSAGAANLVVNGDFSAGNTGFTSGYVYGNDNPPSTYYIGSDPAAVPGAWSDWQNYPTPSGVAGPMFIANGSNVAGTPIWSETIRVVPHATYDFSFYGATQNVYTSYGTGDIQMQVDGADLGGALSLPTSHGVWAQGAENWTNGASDWATITLVDLDTSVASNDFTLDDISFQGPQPIPEPGTWMLLAAGVFGVGAMLRTRRGKRAVRAV